MKKTMTKLFCLWLAVVLALSLSACGKEKEPSDPNRLVIGDYEVQYKSACLMPDSDGEDSIVLTLDFKNNGKDTVDYLWNIFNTATQNGEELLGAIIYVSEDSYETLTDTQFQEVAPGESCEVLVAYTLSDTVNPVEITFSDLLEKYKKTLTLDPSVLPRSDPPGETSSAASAPEASSAPETETSSAAESASSADSGAASDENAALTAFWNGDWYGWWIVTGGDGAYEDWSNQWWDCCANIRINPDLTGSVAVWDEDLPKSNALSEASVTLNPAGTGEHGTLTSESGYFLDGKLSHADWIVDPGLLDYDNLICIDGWYEDDDGSFKYAVYLRPWGTLWDDIKADDPDNLPASYESWYLPLVNAGKSMPDTLGVTIVEDDAKTESSAQSESKPAANDEYGKSNADAAGIAALEDMQSLYKLCYENRSDAYHLFSYEDARDWLRNDGVVFKTPYAWTDTVHTYRWETADGADYFNISFEMEDGEEWYSSCNYSDNVKNNLW